MLISSRCLCAALRKRFKPRDACCALLVLAFAPGISAQNSAAASDLPSSQQVLAFLTHSVEWYRRRAIERQIATDPADLVFLEDNRRTAAQIVQLSFDFARADASVAATSPGGNQKAGTATAAGSSSELARFFQAQQQTELASRQALIQPGLAAFLGGRDNSLHPVIYLAELEAGGYAFPPTRE